MFRRILVLATVILVAAAGCQKAQKAEVSKNDASKSGSADHKGESSKAAAGQGGGAKSAAEGAGGTSSRNGTVGGATTEKAHTAIPKGGLVLTEVDNGRNVDLKPGNVIYVKLVSNHTTGYSWAMVDSSGTVLVHDGGPIYTLVPAKKGGKSTVGTETWRFRAVRSGEQTMRLEYRRPWERNIPLNTFRFMVTVSY